MAGGIFPRAHADIRAVATTGRVDLLWPRQQDALPDQRTIAHAALESLAEAALGQIRPITSRLLNLRHLREVFVDFRIRQFYKELSYSPADQVEICIAFFGRCIGRIANRAVIVKFGEVPAGA